MLLWRVQVQVLISDLKMDKVWQFFISFDTGFHNLSPKLNLVSVPKYVTSIFLFGKCVSTQRNTNRHMQKLTQIDICQSF